MCYLELMKMEYFGVKSADLVVVASLVIGALVILVGFIAGRRTGSARTKFAHVNPAGYPTPPPPPPTHIQRPHHEAFGNIPISSAPGKRNKNKKRRDTTQAFAHPWMVGALKGHTAPVRDMNFSSDGKFLATTAEDCGVVQAEHLEVAAMGPVQQPLERSSPTSQQLTEDNNRTMLSRRQRKNRTRATREQRREHYDDQDDDNNARRCNQEISPKANNLVKNKITNSEKLNQNFSKKFVMTAPQMSEQRNQLSHLTDADLARQLRRYIMKANDLVLHGFPVECINHPGFAVILQQQHYCNRIPQEQQKSRKKHSLDANASEFVPGKILKSSTNESEGDSGNGTGSSVDNSDQESLSDSEKSSESSSSDFHKNSRRHSLANHEVYRSNNPSMQHAVERTCVRCSKNFLTNRTTGNYMTDERCMYHWGKLKHGRIGREYECCGGREGARGCTSAKAHVWTGLTPGFNGPFDDYVKTQPSRMHQSDGYYGIYALDCEMCYTRRGLEIAQVTVVGINGEIVYNTYIKPNEEIIDYNTRFSGITAKHLAGPTKTLKCVQRDLTRFISAETILIGHGLENDMKALKIIHPTIVDTSVAYPHHLGHPYKNSLKNLTMRVLKREIQTGEHNPAEDARGAIDLMLKRIELDLGQS